MNKINKLLLVSSVMLLPNIAFAQVLLRDTDTFFTNLKSLVTTILVPLAFILALLFFFWGVAKYIWGLSGDAKDDGKKIMTWGIVALFVMSTVWGLVYLLRDELGVGPETNVRIPNINTSSGGTNPQGGFLPM